MTLRCRPGDLAFIIRDDPAIGDANIGKVVKVLERARDPFEWRIEVLAPLLVIGRNELAPGYGKVYMVPKGTPEIYHPDAWLRPIRDPGPEAVDETLRVLETL